ncbi:MAG: shikimate dehydrogenase [Nitrospirae bacterium]|nr:shikimate dehydrogenase [Nitrospirota bacterium]
MPERPVRGTVWLVGHPVAHSLSPLIQNTAFRHDTIPWIYLKIDLPQRLVRPFLRILPSTGAVGLNVTVPHKETVVPLLARASRDVEVTRAANCLRVSRAGLEGHNTDGAGFVDALRAESRWDPRGRTILILGAGGAALGIAHALAQAGAGRSVVLNRTPSRAHRLVRRLRAAHPDTAWESDALVAEHLGRYAHESDLVVQTTSVGLDGRSRLPFPFDLLPPRALVTDIVYRPFETPFLRAARRAGRATLGGWAMFLHQAARSYRIWTRRPPPLGVMRRVLLRALNAPR